MRLSFDLFNCRKSNSAAQRDQTSTASEKPGRPNTLIRNSNGSSILFQSDKPASKSATVEGHYVSHAAARLAAAPDTGCLTTYAGKRSPLLVKKLFPPPPYASSKLPCGCEAYFEGVPDASQAGLGHQGGHRETLYYVLDPLVHAEHRTRAPSTTGQAAAAAATRASSDQAFTSASSGQDPMRSSALTTYSSLNNNNDDDKDDNVGSDIVVSDGVIVNVGAVGSDMLDNVNRTSVISDSVTVPELVSDCQLLMAGDEAKLTSREDCSSSNSSQSL